MATSPTLSRRDFLKLAGMAPLALSVPPYLRNLEIKSGAQAASKQNVVVVVFDAFSAKNISLYGYPRDTTPNINRLAERAIVYNNHYAAGNYTTPGTASILTGTMPWTHRAINLGETTSDDFISKTIFNAFSDRYTFAYSHNPAVNVFLTQFARGIADYVPMERLLLINDGFIQSLFGRDKDAATVAWAREMKKQTTGYSYSLFLSDLYTAYQQNKIKSHLADFPRGLPAVNDDNYFLLEDSMDWLADKLTNGEQPFFGYFHMIPPHYPYTAPKEFVGKFGNDGYAPVEKPEDLFRLNLSGKNLPQHRAEYDEFILYVDREFNRLFSNLDKAGALENTWVILTSDHGEMFERGIGGHRTAVLYEPVVRVPLLIFEPGRTTRLDINTPTSAIDLLPTLMKITGHEKPAWAEGKLLPPYAPAEPGRDIYSLQAWYNGKYDPITNATLMLVRDQYKLIYYLGYGQLKKQGIKEFVQLFDLSNDPEELVDISGARPEITGLLLDSLKKKLSEVNQPYEA